MMQSEDNNSSDNEVGIESEADVLVEKLSDAETTPSFEVELDPDEAEKAGAFEEDAISEADALESSADLIDLE
jgi:hypothetical protein